MSGHSKWHNIRVKKMASDAKRGKVYTRHAKLIEIAAQRGGDPVTNASLRMAIENAKAENVPNANIDRAIKKGTGELKGAQMGEIVYAAMGPGNTAYLIECLTDNTNRTLSNLKMVFGKNGGGFAESASVLWMFERKGMVSARCAAWKDEMELELIDAGADDIQHDDDIVTVTTAMTHWAAVRDYFKAQGCEILSAGLRYVATQKAQVKDLETAQKVMSFMAAIEEDDDVSEVHTNADISADIAAGL